MRNMRRKRREISKGTEEKCKKEEMGTIRRKRREISEENKNIRRKRREIIQGREE